MPQVAIHVQEHASRRHESNRCLHPAGSHVAPVGIDAVGNLQLAVPGHVHPPTVLTFLTPRQRLPGRIHHCEIGEMLGEI